MTPILAYSSKPNGLLLSMAVRENRLGFFGHGTSLSRSHKFGVERAGTGFNLSQGEPGTEEGSCL